MMAGVDSLAEIGGRVLLFTCNSCINGIGATKPRDDRLLGTDSENNLLVPQNDQLKALGERCAQSKVVIDKCQSCKGIWLNHGELAKIIRYLEKAVDIKSAKDLSKDTFKKFIKVFTGQKGVISEVKDFLAVLKLLEIRIAVEHPSLTQSWNNIKFVSPYN